MDTFRDNPDLRIESIAARQLVEAMQAHGYDGDDIGIAVEGETDFPEAVAAMVRRIDELEELAGGAKAIAARYVARAKDLEARRELLREALADALERALVPLPLRLPVGTVGLTNTAPTAIITDEDLVPDEYRRTKTTTTIDMRSVTLDLRDRKTVPGAVLRNSRKSLMVRRA